MSNSQRNILLIAVLSTLLVIAAVLLISRLYQGDGTLLTDVTLTETSITPNADGDIDATEIAYSLTRNATVSIFFESQADGQRHYFRNQKLRGVGDYRVQFSGVVEGYTLEDEVVAGEILARLLQNGDYTWVIEAIDEDGVSETQTGTLTISDADTALPDMAGFEISPTSFTPNRDGIDDRIKVQFFLQKEAETYVYLETEDKVQVPIQELPGNVRSGMVGRHVFDYEGGVDQGAQPPPDGTYTIFAIASDLEGQRIRQQGQVTMEYGGVPRADIQSPVSGDTLQFSATTIELCDTLMFSITIHNYGETPIRTTGPFPGTVYDSDWNYNTLGWNTESGAWRLAIGYENELKDYPFRWGLGTPEELLKIGDHYYLDVDQQIVITGGIRMTGSLGERNPQPMWAGLIHEDVEIAQFNNRVDTQLIELDFPPVEQQIDCEPRALPSRP